LITGGSQGAQAINDALWEALPKLLSIEPKIQILHQVGDKNLEQYQQRMRTASENFPADRYVVRGYVRDMYQAYACTDLALCRAGAMTIADLTASATPAIFVPYPFAAQDHQTKNAQYVESKGAGVAIRQNDLTPAKLIETVSELFSDETKMNSMKSRMRELGKPRAAADIAAQLQAISRGHHSHSDAIA
jgi:UDP-N-acetylglucosamine--N-acetylmuramyl-(pentapeptide) pyrophosphoryl-undecaprenol N-acetylglucosamine transferase